MACFSSQETREIDRIWRTLPSEHVWSGWAAISDAPREVWLYRRQQNWRRFPLVKEANGYCLYDDRDCKIACAAQLQDVIGSIERIPARVDS